jgi:acetyl-CoA carboxylase biotin carboxylase subunit
MKLFTKILIANRGEIAVRVIKSAKKLGIKTVAVYSEVDENALHVEMADEAWCIGKQELSETYLNIEKIINIAKQSSSDAIHPGYGFLSENPLLVDACEKNNITFIGPNTNAIKLMGNKIEARSLVKKIGVPMTEGITGNTEELLAKANQIPFPILVKAAAGGGGKGMRIVHKEENLAKIIESTSREAENYFGDGSVFIEKYVEEPRHIEFQVLGDNFGNIIHLFERECSIQRRYQKIIEEAPSPTLNEEVRKKMGMDAIKIAKAVDYNSVGTIEFLVDKNLNYYFLEMNTRIQVEHPVTEMVSGIDLVEEQIKVAAGNKLSLNQEEIKQNGHALECRIYAEDPLNNFLPSPGEITFYKQPEGENIRIDSGINKAETIHSFFDPMISKLVVWAPDRKSAIAKSICSLNGYFIHGIKNNIPYLVQLLKHNAFVENNISTKFCDEHSEEIIKNIDLDNKSIDGNIHLLAFAVYGLKSSALKRNKNTWEEIGYWRNKMVLGFNINDEQKYLELLSVENNLFRFKDLEKEFSVNLKSIGINEIEIIYNNKITKVFISESERGISSVSAFGQTFLLERTDIINNKRIYSSVGGDSNGNNLFSPMPGKVIKVNVREGDEVCRGSVMMVVEAMKMENNITSVVDAIVEKVNVNVDDMVDTSTQLVFLKNKDV